LAIWIFGWNSIARMRQERRGSRMERREFLHTATAALLTAGSRRISRADRGSDALVFSTANRRWQQAYDKALQVLAGNVQTLPRYDAPVLIEGADYAGIWLECGPHEALVYRLFRGDVARNSHMTFFALQRPDGQIPANNKRTETGFGQIQMGVPIAATAWELARSTGDEELLRTAYDSCARWDDWLMRYRNTRGTGLVEGFCTYDTGHDNSPRWAGMPNRCPDGDARICPVAPGLPRLCPDLSATVYGGRVALAAMARALGRGVEADRWAASAERIRQLILAKLYVLEDAAFYDLDAQGHFVRVRSDILSRVCGEHVVDQKTFDFLWERQIHNPKAFWAPYPLPSIALDDPAFVRPIPRNSWGGASQALTALRAPRWFEHYVKAAELSFLMSRWCEAIQRDMTFRQQIDPMTGEFTQGDMPNYSPVSLCMIDFTWRLAGVRDEDDLLEWNVRPGCAASQDAHFSMQLGKSHTAGMTYDKKGVTLQLDGRVIGRIESGTARLITDKQGRPKLLAGISEVVETVSIRLGSRRARRITLQPNQQLQLG
jgi:hypothetical protein